MYKTQVDRFAPATRRFHQTSGTAYAMVAVFDTLRVSLDLWGVLRRLARPDLCLLYTSDAADQRSSVDPGGRRIIKKKTPAQATCTPATSIYLIHI